MKVNPATTNKHRAEHFDSMRGIAACLVATTHFLAAFYPYSVFGLGNDNVQHYWWESVMHFPPFSLLTAGHFAVCLFFVLSGYVLSIRSIGEKGHMLRLLGAIVKRPVRLAGVLLFSLLCAGLLFEFNGFHNTDASTLSGSSWFARYWIDGFSWLELFKKILMLKAGSEYNPPLWTLRIEIIGSFMVFGLLIVINYLPYFLRTVILIVCLVITYHTFYDGFIWGMLLADLKKHIGIFQLSVKNSMIGATIGTLMAAMPYYVFKQNFSNVEPAFSLVQLSYPHTPMLVAVGILILVLSSTELQNALTNPVLIWVGQISYALYAMHLLIIGSVAAYIQSIATAHIGYGLTTIVAFSAYLCLLLVISWFVTVTIDNPSIRLANRVDNFVHKLMGDFHRQRSYQK